jgi:hypothetical protein
MGISVTDPAPTLRLPQGEQSGWRNTNCAGGSVIAAVNSLYVRQSIKFSVNSRPGWLLMLALAFLSAR